MHRAARPTTVRDLLGRGPPERMPSVRRQCYPHAHRCRYVAVQPPFSTPRQSPSLPAPRRLPVRVGPRPSLSVVPWPPGRPARRGARRFGAVSRAPPCSLIPCWFKSDAPFGRRSLQPTVRRPQARDELTRRRRWFWRICSLRKSLRFARSLDPGTEQRQAEPVGVVGPRTPEVRRSPCEGYGRIGVIEIQPGPTFEALMCPRP